MDNLNNKNTTEENKASELFGVNLNDHKQNTTDIDKVGNLFNLNLNEKKDQTNPYNDLIKPKTYRYSDETRKKIQDYHDEYAKNYGQRYNIQNIKMQDILNDTGIDKDDTMGERRQEVWGENTNNYRINEDLLNKEYQHPITLEKKDGKYRILDGNHRLRALANDGYDEIEALIKDNQKDINITTTGMSYYDQFLENPEYMAKKNLKGEIVQMTPRQYYEKCANLFDTTVEDLLEQRNLDENKDYMDELRKVEKFKLPMIDYASKGQEGLHRMLILGERSGWDTPQPVLSVNYIDEEKARLNEIRRNQQDIENRTSDILRKLDNMDYDSYDEFKDEVKYQIPRYYEIKFEDDYYKIIDPDTNASVEHSYPDKIKKMKYFNTK